MIESIKFENYRNLDKEYFFNNKCNFIFGKNNSGKSNLLDGIRLAFSSFDGNYVKIQKTDFRDCNEDLVINITVKLKEDSIGSLMCTDENGNKKYGFILRIIKHSSGRYIKRLYYLNDSPIQAMDIIESDDDIPNVCEIPLIRIEDIYNDGLTTKLEKFLDEDSNFDKIIIDAKNKVKYEMKDKREEFTNFSNKFGHNMDIDLTNPSISHQKLYVIDGDSEYNSKIGSGFKSIANIILNTMDERYKIILIDEIENHLHPSLLRTLLREIRTVTDIQIIATTHSPIIINECNFKELVDIKGRNIFSLTTESITKLDKFLTSERSEIVFSDNVILVEGYTEKMLLSNYLIKENHNWTVINVAGVMFKPYIELANLLNKKIVVISDTDLIRNEGKSTNRFNDLKLYCEEKNIKIIEMENTLESDLAKNNLIPDDLSVKYLSSNNGYQIAKYPKCKTELANELINNEIELSNWHVIKEIIDEFGDN